MVSLKWNMSTTEKKQFLSDPVCRWPWGLLEDGQWGLLTEDKNWKAAVCESRNRKCWILVVLGYRQPEPLCEWSLSSIKQLVTRLCLKDGFGLQITATLQVTEQTSVTVCILFGRWLFFNVARDNLCFFLFPVIFHSYTMWCSYFSAVLLLSVGFHLVLLLAA